VTPVVGGWVVGQRPKKDQGQVFVGGPSPKNAPRRDTKKSRKNDFGIFVGLLGKTFRYCLLANALCFEHPSLRNTRKRDKTKKVEGELASKCLSIFYGKSFDMDFL
jgi:hypothetical protein